MFFVSKLSKSQRKAIVVILLPVSLVVFFVLFLIIRDQIREHIIYGNIEKQKIITKENIHMTGTRGSNENVRRDFTLISLKDQKKYKSIFIFDKENGGVKKKFNRQVEVGDTVTVKVISSSEAKILEYKGMQVQPYISYLNLFWYYLFILFLIFLVIFPYYILIKYKK